MGTIFSKPSEGRKDNLGHREFIIESKIGSKGFVTYKIRNNPLFHLPKIITKPRITADWYGNLIAELRAERQYQKLSQMTLAQKLNTRQAVISNFENGKTNPSIEFLINYANVLGKNLSIKIKTAL